MGWRNIDHVVVLMQENNSFDRVFGWMSPDAHDVDGVPPGACNPVGWPLFTDGETVAAGPGAHMISPGAPHQYPDMWQQLHPAGGRPNDGFAKVQARYASRRHFTDAERVELVREVMRHHDRDALPVTRDLALGFAVADRWFASISSNTWPNRYFLHMGTSPSGAVPLPQLGRRPTIFSRLTDKGLAWRIYVDGPSCLFTTSAVLRDIRRVARSNRTAGLRDDDASPLRPWARFGCDVSRAAPLSGRPGDAAFFSAMGVDLARAPLPAYTFIEPRHVGGRRPPNNDHSGRHKHWGQRLLADVYNTLRADEAVWSRTLLVVLYDEHGGYYDHVPPPPAPHPRTGRPGRRPRPGAMDYYGARVPALLISPWIRRGGYHAICDHTSVLAFLERRFGLAPLSRRDALADDLTAAFTDVWDPGPKRIEPPPAPAQTTAEITALEDDLYRHLATLSGADGDREIASLPAEERLERAERRAEALRRVVQA